MKLKIINQTLREREVRAKLVHNAMQPMQCDAIAMHFEYGPGKPRSRAPPGIVPRHRPHMQESYFINFIIDV